MFELRPVTVAGDDVIRFDGFLGKVPVVGAPEGFVGVIVYWTYGMLVRPAQERDTPTTLEILPTRFILIGVAVDKAKPVVFRGVVKDTGKGVLDATPFTAVNVPEYAVLSERPGIVKLFGPDVNKGEKV